MFKSIGKRVMGALNGIATKGEIATIDRGLTAIVDSHSPSGVTTATNDVRKAARKQRQRSTRNPRFHAKRGGALQYGTVAHDMANSRVVQLMYNPLLTALIYREGHMGVVYKG